VDRAAARKAWRRLDEGTRRDVYALARQGDPHPDPEVVAIAFGWGSQCRPRRLWRLAVGLAVVGLLLVLANRVTDGSLGWSWSGVAIGLAAGVLMVVPEWWLARRVAQANAPPGERRGGG
jgi:peptidoglycan/LPS O-acetylase OafA/YrhL